MLERPQPRDKSAAAHSPLPIRRVDAIPVALPLKSPMKMSGITIATAENVLVRIEAADGRVGWGEAASAPTMTGDTLGGLVAAVRDHLAPLLIGQDAFDRPALVLALRRALMGNTGAHSAVEMALLDLDRPRRQQAAGRCRGAEAAAHDGQADVAARQRDARAGHRRSAREGARGLPLLQAQDRREAARRRDRGRACRARSARHEDAAVRRRQWRADARQRQALCRAHARGQARLHRAAAAA